MSLVDSQRLMVEDGAPLDCMRTPAPPIAAEQSHQEPQPVSAIFRAIEAAKQLRLHIAFLVAGDKAAAENTELTEDDRRTIQDSFDGETSLEVEIERAVAAEDDDYILVSGIEKRQAELKDRKARIEKRIESRRGLIEQAMTIAGWEKRETPLGTVSLKANPPSVEIDQENEIPTQFWKRQDPTLDKASLRSILIERHKAMEAAKKIKNAEQRAAVLAKAENEHPPIPGCHLETSHTSLTIRRK